MEEMQNDSKEMRLIHFEKFLLTHNRKSDYSYRGVNRKQAGWDGKGAE